MEQEIEEKALTQLYFHEALLGLDSTRCLSVADMWEFFYFKHVIVREVIDGEREVHQ